MTSKNYILVGQLNNYGFCIKKKNLNNIVYDILKKFFTVKPDSSFDDEVNDDSKIFNIFYEDDNYVVLPKFTPNIKISISKYNNDNLLIYYLTFIIF